LSPTGFEPRRFILKKTAVYAVWYVVQSGRWDSVFETEHTLKHSPIHQTAHTDTCTTYHTAYTAVSLRMNSRGSKHVGDIRD